MSPVTTSTNLGMTSDGARGVPGHVPASARPLAIVGASLIDATAQRPRTQRTVIVRDGRITAVGGVNRVDVPADADVIDATGKFLLPGLWDMHVHQFDSAYLDAHLRNGVTGIRHMGGIAAHHEWRRQIGDGTLPGPRTILASPIIDGPAPLRPGSVAVHDADGARKAVTDAHEWGAEFIKIYNLIPHDAFDALSQECTGRRIPFVGHLPLTVSIEEASNRGQASIEHLEGLLIATSSRRDDLRQQVHKLHVRTLADMEPLHELNHQAAASHDATLAVDLFDRLAANRTWHTPTLAVLEAATLAATPQFPLTDYMPYIEPYLKPIWEGANVAVRNHDEQLRAQALLTFQLGLVHQLNESGVPLLAGTDTFVPGFSLHDELRLLVKAGLSPWAALCAATHNPAVFLGIEDSFGTIEPGKVADLILLHASPLEDISNTRSLERTILAGNIHQSHSTSND